MKVSTISFWIATVSMTSTVKLTLASPELITTSLRGSEAAERLLEPLQLWDPSTLRFSKCPLIVEGSSPPIWMTPADYPLSDEKGRTLRYETYADSVVVHDDHQLNALDAQHQSGQYWLDSGNINPAFPGDADGTYWDELRHVTEVQIARRAGNPPSTLNRWPDGWSGKTTLDEMAQAVAGEYPAYHQQTVIEAMFGEGLEMNRDMGFSPFRSVNDFIGKQVRVAAINTWAFEAVAPVSFMLKWHIGMPRPEEVAWMIATDALTTDGIPSDLVALIKSMDLQSAFDFTAYAGGSPNHPSFPAMHSAGSTCSTWLPVIANITPEQYCEALRMDYAVAYGRTIAGVHYQMDNLAGLNIGQRVISNQLPSMLSERYGYDSALVASKLEALAFDWNTFESATCTIDGVSAAEFLANADLLPTSTPPVSISTVAPTVAPTDAPTPTPHYNGRCRAITRAALDAAGFNDQATTNRECKKCGSSSRKGGHKSRYPCNKRNPAVCEGRCGF